MKFYIGIQFIIILLEVTVKMVDCVLLLLRKSSSFLNDSPVFSRRNSPQNKRKLTVKQEKIKYFSNSRDRDGKTSIMYLWWVGWPHP